MTVQRNINAEILKNTKSIKKTLQIKRPFQHSPVQKKSPSQNDGRKDRKLKKNIAKKKKKKKKKKKNYQDLERRAEHPVRFPKEQRSPRPNTHKK